MQSVFVRLVTIMVTVTSGFSVSTAIGAGNDMEIEHLLSAIGQSECVFTRNGKQHSATEAERHLRMKYDRTRSRIKTAEAFIDRLASESSWTGKRYTLQCADGASGPSGEWLYRELSRYRRN